MGQNGWHVGDKRRQSVTEPLKRTLIPLRHDPLGHGLSEVSKKPMFSKELMPPGCPIVALSQSTKISIMVPSEMTVDCARMQSSEIGGQTLPVARGILSGLERFQEEKVLELGQHLRGSHTASGAKRGKTRGFDLEKAVWYVCHGLGHEMGTVGVGQSPGLRNGAS